jgi:glycogen debranching enzyme
VSHGGVAGLDALLSDEGWAYASLPPQEPGDPGRFHALFGRDSLITALQVLPAAPDVARGTLRALAALQGRVDDPATDEEPGKILHEYRPNAGAWFVEAGWPLRDGRLQYYGTADATSWFLIVLAALDDAALSAELEPAWRAAAGWLVRALDAGGGLVRYGPRGGGGGLAQQGWRDAIAPVEHHPEGAGIVRPDGSAPAPPLADADCQAAAVAALDALARLDGAGGWEERAAALRARVTAAFAPGGGGAGERHVEGDAVAGGGSGERRIEGDAVRGGGSGERRIEGDAVAGGGSGAEWALAIEGDGRVVTGAGSHLGWLLWAGALEGDAAARAAERLVQPDVLTDFGLRTLSSAHPAFRAHAYHRGGVWPFDCWLGWAGLRAAGREAEAERVRTGVLAALGTLGLAPELYAVTPAGELEPVPVANRVQAWTVGARWAFEHDWAPTVCT